MTRFLFLLLLSLVVICPKSQAQDWDVKFNAAPITENDFAGLEDAITQQKAWVVKDQPDARSREIMKRVYDSEIRKMELGIKQAELVFAPKPGKFGLNYKKKIEPDSTVSFSANRSTSLLKHFWIWSLGKETWGKPTYLMKHNNPGELMPSAGFTLDGAQRDQVRVLLHATEGSSVVIMYPEQVSSLSSGFMACPRTYTGIKSGTGGVLLKTNDYRIKTINAEVFGEVWSKVLDGFGDGKILNRIFVQSYPSENRLIQFEDYNQGYFPDGVLVFPTHKRKISAPFVPDKLNELSLGVEVASQDSGQNELLLSFSQSIGILPIELAKKQLMYVGQDTAVVEPGPCYLVIERFKFVGERRQGTKVIEIPK